MKIFIILSLIVFSITAKAEAPLRNGYWWTGMERNIGGGESSTDPYIKEAARVMKQMFIEGYFDGVENLWLYRDTSDFSALYRLMNGVNYDASRTVTVGQYVDGLGKFYEDYRNMNILVFQAMSIVAMQVTGKSQENIDWQTRYFRADKQTQNEMVNKRYKIK